MASDWLIVLSFFIGIIIVLFLVTLHELGHFVVAKIAKAYVYEFSIGFGPRLFTIRGKETWFSVRLFPLGGFCSIASDKADPPKGREDLEIPNDRKIDYIARWKKAFFIISGPLFNLFIAIFLFTTIFGATQIKTNDMNYFGAKYSGISSSLLDQKISNDVLLQGVNRGQYILMGWEITTEKDANQLNDTNVIFNNADVNVSTKYKINDAAIYSDVEKTSTASSFTTTVYTALDHLKDNKRNIDTSGNIYIRFFFRTTESLYSSQLKNNLFVTDFSKDGDYAFGSTIGIAPPTRHFASVGQAYGYGWKETFTESFSIFKSLGMLITGHIGQFSGPVGMSRQVASMLTRSDSFFLYVALLSANLFVINLITIPPLDGYKFLENIIEACMRREIPDKVKIWMYTIGASLFAILFIAITIKDFVV